MLSAQFRLHERKDFTHILRSGKSASFPLFTVRWKSTSFPNPRFGFIVSNKISKKAVVRNKVKRRLRETIRLHLPSFPQQADYIFIAKQAIVKAEMSEIVETVSRFIAPL